MLVVTADYQVNVVILPSLIHRVSLNKNHGVSHCICGMTLLTFKESLEFELPLQL